ncbi:hypothetical protein WN943_011173 [Citrus x changshan-huyou]
MAGVVQSLFIPSYDASRIPFLRGDNFKEWKEKILLTLGCMDLDLALRVDEPLGIRCLHMWKLWPVGTYKLDLNFGFVLDLDKMFYITSFSRNLISVSRLLPLSFSFNFIGTSFHKEFVEVAIDFGRSIAERKLYLVYRGGNRGLSKLVSKAAFVRGSQVLASSQEP